MSDINKYQNIKIHTLDSIIHEERVQEKLWCFVDWVLPDLSGLEMCRRLRNCSATANSHITMVLDENDSEARRRALKSGADDYLIGPLTPELLVSRIGEYQHGKDGLSAHIELSHSYLTVDLAAHQARWRGKPIILMPNQFRLLTHFIKHRDQVLSRGQLVALLGKEGDRIDERTVDVWVVRLRRALRASGAPDLLRTVRSVGYIMDRLPQQG